MRCGQCQRELPDGAAFCPSCGANVPSSVAVATLDEPRTYVADGEIAGRNCPYCLFPLKQGAGVTECGSCRAIHHRDCWGENHGCAIGSCPSGPAAPSGHGMRRDGYARVATTSGRATSPFDFAPPPT